MVIWCLIIINQKNNLVVAVGQIIYNKVGQINYLTHSTCNIIQWKNPTKQNYLFNGTRM